jgi:hypothetical protein
VRPLKTLGRLIWRWRRAIAFVVVTGIAVSSLALAVNLQNLRADDQERQLQFQQQELDQVRQVAANAKDDACERNAETRQAVINLVDGYLGADIPVADDDHSDAAARTRHSNVLKAGARDFAAATLMPDFCADGKPPVVPTPLPPPDLGG